jgi:hypothetical protein
LRLAADEIWGVRKAAAESLVAVSKALEPAARCSDLIPVFERLVADASKWVRNATLTNLGPFLATLPGAKISQQLLRHFLFAGLSGESAVGGASVGVLSLSATSIGVTARTGMDPTDADLAQHAAFSFPAVVLSLGRARWPELRELFHSLARDAQRRVRRPLAHALAELARIIGPDAAEIDLAPAMDIFLHDVDEVRNGALRCLGPFIAALAPDAREGFAATLEELRVASLPLNWRARRTLATALPTLAGSLSLSTVRSDIIPFTLALLRDDVAAVRDEARAGIPPLLSKLAMGALSSNAVAAAAAAAGAALASDLLSEATAVSARTRAGFVRTTAALMAAEAVEIDAHAWRSGSANDAGTALPTPLLRGISKDFIARLPALARDPVRNVRASVAGALAPLASALAAAGSSTSLSGAGAVSSATVAPPLPPWAEGDALAPLREALVALANDSDSQVLMLLGDLWVGCARVVTSTPPVQAEETVAVR